MNNTHLMNILTIYKHTEWEVLNIEEGSGDGGVLSPV